LGRDLIEMDQSAEAVDALQRAIELDPDNTTAHRDLGRSLLDSGNPMEAAEVFARAIGLAERDGDIRTGREIHQYLRKAEQPSVHSVERSAQRSAYRPPVPDARTLCREGFQHFAGDRIEQAIDCYRLAAETEPQLAIAWSGLSKTLQRKGDLDGAVKAGLKLVALEPLDPLSHTNLSILYQAKGLIEKAEDEKARASQLQAEGEAKA
jgi:Flp pilus assembly protein TadD